MKKIYNIVITEKFEKKEGGKTVEGTVYTTVGVAFFNEGSGSLSCKLKPNISISGEFVLFEKK